jgi:hypothetical protein
MKIQPGQPAKNFTSRESILKYVGKQNIPFPVIADPERLLYQLYLVLGINSVRMGMETKTFEIIQHAVFNVGAAFQPRFAPDHCQIDRGWKAAPTLSFLLLGNTSALRFLRPINPGTPCSAF